MYGYLYILIPCIVIIVLLIFMFSNNRFRNLEGFRSRYQTMDTVLDYRCFSNNMKTNNYINYASWDSHLSESGVGETAECGTYECPMETCKVLTSNNLFGRIDYSYKTRLSNQIECGDDDPTKCICKSAHDPTSNVYCDSTIEIPQCGMVQNKECFSFDQTNQKWTTHTFNEYLSSNGETCTYQDTQYPFTPMYYSNESNPNLSKGTYVPATEGTTGTKVCYDTKGPKCRLSKDSKYDNRYIIDGDYNNYVEKPTNTTRFIQERNHFDCDNGNQLRYGYSNTSASTPADGKTCGFIDADCSNCAISKKTCYLFDSNIREYSSNIFINMYWEGRTKSVGTSVPTSLTSEQSSVETSELVEVIPGVSTDDSSLQCDSYKVFKTNPQVDNFDNFEWRGYLKEYDFLDGMFLEKRTPRTFTTLTTWEATNNNCSNDINPTMCSIKDTILLKKGSSLKSPIQDEIERSQSSTLNVVDINDNEVLLEKQFHDITYRRRWNSNGSACEYCVVDTFGGSGDILDDCASNAVVDDDLSCDLGETLVQNDLNISYCRICSSNEYYDEENSNCKMLSGCEAGKRFDPPDLEEGKSYLTSDTNIDDDCTPCESNTYISDTTHMRRQCKTCDETRDDDNYVYTVNDTNTECSRCGNSVQRNTYNTAGWIVVDASSDDTTPTCSNCLHYGDADEDVKAQVATIVGLTEYDIFGDRQDSKCIKRCGVGKYNNDGTKMYIQNSRNSDKELIDDGTFERCPYYCPTGYFANNGSCEQCPKGTELKDGNCLKCQDGFYNNRIGGRCISCPVTYGAVSSKPISTSFSNVIDGTSSNGATDISHCRVECLDMSNNEPVYGYYDTSRSIKQYNLDECPKTECVAGYIKQPLSDATMGYTLSNVFGEQNRSKGETGMSTCHIDDKDDLVMSDSCVTDSSGNSYNEGKYEKGTTCCKGSLYSTEYNVCRCRTLLTQEDPLALRDKIWNGSKCIKQCKPYNDEGGEIKLVGWNCELTCNDGVNGFYQNKSTGSSVPDTCSSCPVAPASSNTGPPWINANNNDSETDCYIKSCKEGYELDSPSPSYYNGTSYSPACKEKKVQCEVLKPQPAGDFSTPLFYLDPSKPGISVFGKEWSNVAWEETDDGSCRPINTINSGQAIGNFHVKCDSAGHSLNIGGTTSFVDLVTGERKFPSGKRPLFCCPNDKIHMTGEFETKFVTGCCALGELLKADGGCAEACTEGLNQSFERDETGKCVYTCDVGFQDNTDADATSS